MSYMLVRHKVADYAAWKAIFDEHGATRKSSGSNGARIFRNANDSSEVIGLFEWSDHEKAKQFAESDNLREIMMSAGVTDHPDIYFLDETDQQPQ